jgi:cytochrome P450
MTDHLSSVPTAPRRLPGIGHLAELVFRPLDFVCSLRNYGDVVKIYLGKTPAIVVNSTDLIRRIFATESNAFKRGKVNQKLQAFLGQGLATSDDPLHHKQRQIMQPAFQHDKMGNYIGIMRELTKKWASSRKPGRHMVLEKSLRELVFRIITNSLIQVNFANSAAEELAVTGSIISKEIFWHLIMPDWFNRLSTKGNQRLRAAGHRLRITAEQVITIYKTTKPDSHDLLSMLLMARDPETNTTLSQEELIDQITTIIFAGSETTSNALICFFYEIAKHQEIQQQLFHELDKVLAGRPIEVSDIPNLVYLRNVIHESLRLFPPGWLLTRQTIREVQLSKFAIPPGTEILISPYSVHRDPTIFHNPLTFDPNRWERDNKKLMRNAFIPFANGPHLCIGNHFSLTSITVIIATAMSQWSFRLAKRPRRYRVRLTLSAPKVPIRLEHRPKQLST